MFSILILIAAFVAILADIYVYKTRMNKFRWLWIFQSVLFTFPVVAIFAMGYFVDNRSQIWQNVSIWILSLFITHFLCKIFIVLAILIKDKKGKSYFPVAIVLTVVFVGIYLYGTFVSRCNLVVKRIEIASKDLPLAFDGYKIVLFSDIHLGTMYLDGNLLERVVDTTNTLNPDIAVQCGDLLNIHISELDERRINILKKLKAPVYSVLGNHDLGYYLRDTLEESPKVTVDSLSKIETEVLGWHLLKNEKTVIYKDCDSILIAGVTFPTNLSLHNYNSTYGGSDIRNAMSGIDSSQYSILISHTPQLIDSLPEKSNAVDLMLSGHVHAMQLRLANICPAFLFYGVNTGYNQKNNVSLYVNDGIGVVGHPFRYGAPPEITLITLKHYE